MFQPLLNISALSKTMLYWCYGALWVIARCVGKSIMHSARAGAGNKDMVVVVKRVLSSS
jgi:hypothetical protein